MDQNVYLEFKWGTSRGRDTYGYAICSLYADGVLVARCNGGGYDMKGTAFGDYIAGKFQRRLIERITGQPVECPVCKGAGSYDNPNPDGQQPARCYKCEGTGKILPEYYGLTFHDPDYDPGKAVIGKDCHDRTLSGPGEVGAEGLTVAEAEAKGISFGLERYQAAYSASTKFPDDQHRNAAIDGACGFDSVKRIAEAIGLSLQYCSTASKLREAYILTIGQ